MTTSNWIALAAFVIPTFGALCVAAYHLIKLLIKSSIDDIEITRLTEENKSKEDKINRLQEQIRDMN